MQKKKTKFFRSLKTDPLDQVFSNMGTKVDFRSMREIKNDLYDKVKQNVNLYNYISDKSISSVLVDVESEFNKEGVLDFGSQNKRNVFVRKKRKSGYGLSLIEKQKAKYLFPAYGEKKMRQYAVSSESRLPDLMRTTIPYVSFMLGLSPRKDHSFFVDEKSVEKEPFFRIVPSSVVSFPYFESFSRFPLLSYKSVSRDSFFIKRERIFDRIPPNYLCIDLRLKKFTIVKDTVHRNNHLHIDFDRLSSHYKSRRN